MVHWIAPMIFSCLIAIANVSFLVLNSHTQDFQLTRYSTLFTWPRLTTWLPVTGRIPRLQQEEMRLLEIFSPVLPRCIRRPVSHLVRYLGAQR